MVSIWWVSLASSKKLIAYTTKIKKKNLAFVAKKAYISLYVITYHDKYCFL